MTDPARYGAREAREDAAYDRAWKRAMACEKYWAEIRDAAAIIKAACAELIAEDAYHGVVHTGQKYQQVGEDANGRPVMEKRPGVITTDLDAIAAAVSEIDTIDVRLTMEKQRDAWAAEELEGDA